MTALTIFPAKSRVAVVGASGGVGQALVERFAKDPRVDQVIALSRTPCPVSSPRVTQGELDLENEASITNCAKSVSSDSPVDIVVVATGILWSGETLRPEKSMLELDMDKPAKRFAINATGPAMVAKHFLPTLPRKRDTTQSLKLVVRRSLACVDSVYRWPPTWRAPTFM